MEKEGVEGGFLFGMIYSWPALLTLWGCHLVMRRRDGARRNRSRNGSYSVSYPPPPLRSAFVMLCSVGREGGCWECFRDNCMWKRGVVLVCELGNVFFFVLGRQRADDEPTEDSMTPSEGVWSFVCAVPTWAGCLAPVRWVQFLFF